MLSYWNCPCAFGVLLLAASAATPAEKEKGDKIPTAARTILDKAESFELYSIDPVKPDKKPKDDFLGWKVLGKTAVKDADVRKKLIEALAAGAAENKGEVADCFNPRHGIRAKFDGKTVDLVICFECNQVEGTTS